MMRGAMTMEKLTLRWSSRTNESERGNKSLGMHVSIDGLSIVGPNSVQQTTTNSNIGICQDLQTGRK